MKLAGSIILYHPDDKVMNNINSYMNDLDELFVIDNSEKVQVLIVEQLKSNPKVIYHWNRENKGVAYALNYAAYSAIKRGYEWLILFDQDSYAQQGMIPRLIDFIMKNNTDRIGIVSADQKIDTENQAKHFRDYEYCDMVITSGSTINLNIYQKIGRFEERLFIDMVDHEYCLRLKKHGYKIMKITKAMLFHEVGRRKVIKNRQVSLHSYVRVYYFVRNILYVRGKYGKRYPDLVNGLTKEVYHRCRDNLIYGEERLKQVKSILQGAYDYKAGHWGKNK